ncbi:MAG: sigma-54-dependent Fis family transcriptional regulator [Bacteroidetes bacterium]|nr:MAG: sigma-54-dependent Fis family transcriptional regulator [Bacteroidota bacterium]
MIDAHILIIDDDKDILETARMFLKQQFSTVIIDSDPKNLPKHLSNSSLDLILLDMNFRKGVNDGEEGFYWLEMIRKYDPDIIVVLITAYGEVDVAVKAMKNGATDFVLKPWKNQKLLATLLAALELRKTKKTIRNLKATQERLVENITQPHQHFIGKSPVMQTVHQLINKVADTDANVLILGENGTGKELVARALHTKSSRKSLPFISVDMGAVSETLFESELFGHIKGAFTDAHEDKKGSFELAGTGTIFLDEIANLPLNLQTKLLSVLENRIVRPVGSNIDIPMKARLVCATNVQLKQMVADNTFREDLLYRINTVEIQLPPLRDRPEDIEPLVHYFEEDYSAKYKKEPLKLETKAFDLLRSYHWPGNVRELQHTIERAVILAEGGSLENIDLLSKRSLESVGEAETLEEMEKIFILKKLSENGGNVSKTAIALGLTRTAMYRRLNKHGLV